MYELSPEVRTRALEEALRVLRPGGRFLMMEHCEPTRPFVRFLYQARLATMGSARKRPFARDEVPFLRRFFRDVKQQVSPTSRSKLTWGVKEPAGAAAEAASPSVGRRRHSWSKPRETNDNPSVALLRSRLPIEVITISRSGRSRSAECAEVTTMSNGFGSRCYTVLGLKNGGRYPDVNGILAGQEFLLGNA
jgi:SAM-dependent methyltransferase